MSAKPATWRVPSKLEMAKAIAEQRAQAYSLDELVEIAAEVMEASVLKLPLTIVRQAYEQLRREGQACD